MVAEYAFVNQRCKGLIKVYKAALCAASLFEWRLRDDYAGGELVNYCFFIAKRSESLLG